MSDEASHTQPATSPNGEVDVAPHQLGRWRHPYSHRKWRKLRKLQLQREPLCAFCKAQGLITPAVVADHVTPYRDKKDAINRFWCGKLQSLCARCHDGTKRNQEQRERMPWLPDVGVDGMPIDRRHPAWIERA